MNNTTFKTVAHLIKATSTLLDQHKIWSVISQVEAGQINEAVTAIDNYPYADFFEDLYMFLKNQKYRSTSNQLATFFLVADTYFHYTREKIKQLESQRPLSELELREKVAAAANKYFSR